MKHPKGVNCTLKSPGDWPLEYHDAIRTAYKHGECEIYRGPDLTKAEYKARQIRELLRKLPHHPAHPTQVLITNPRKSFRTGITQTGLQEWMMVLKSGPWTNGWLDKFKD